MFSLIDKTRHAIVMHIPSSRKRYSYLATVCLSVILLLSTGFLTKFAMAQQSRATISGQVTDASGGVIPKAAVAVTAEDTGVTRTTVTNDVGEWQIQGLIPGNYHFTITAPGFSTERHANIALQIGDQKRFDVHLTVGATTQTIEVTSETPLIDTSAAVSGTVLTQQELMDLPSQTHLVTMAAAYVPGVAMADQGQNALHSWSNDGASQLWANGGRNSAWSNNFQLDGQMNTKSGGDISFIPPAESISQVRVVTNAYDAAIGRQAGATVQLETRSGTKNLHGSAYWYSQTSLLAAQITGVLGSPPQRTNQYGFSVGGPVWFPRFYNKRNRSFFFVSWDKTTNRNSNASVFSVPTLLERNGDFSQSYTYSGGVKYPYRIYDPLAITSAPSCTSCNRAEFTSGGVRDVIPTNRISPVAANILKLMPLPNRTQTAQDLLSSNTYNNYSSPGNRIDDNPVLAIRGDQNWNNSHHSSITFGWAHLHESTGHSFEDTNILSGTEAERIAWRAGISHDWTMSANRLLNLRLAFVRWSSPSHSPGAGYDPTQLGMSGGWLSQLQMPSFPYIYTNGTWGNGSPNLGTSQAGSSDISTDYTSGATVTQMWGHHNFRAGGEYYVQQKANNGIGNQGSFDFSSNTWTKSNNTNTAGAGEGNNFAGFLLGLPLTSSNSNAPVNASSLYSQHYFSIFLQDDWRVTPKLTLNIGVRYEVELPYTERFDRATDRYQIDAVNPVSDTAATKTQSLLGTTNINVGTNGQTGYNSTSVLGLLPSSQLVVHGVTTYLGKNGAPRTAINTDWTEIQPRVGFAYQLGQNLVIRAGFGKFVTGSDIYPGQFGYSRTTSLTTTNDNYKTPADTLDNPFSSGIQQPVGSALGAMGSLGATPGTWNLAHKGLGQNTGYGNDIHRPNSWNYSVRLDQQVKDWLFEFGYSHNKTYNIGYSYNMNMPSFDNWYLLRTAVFDQSDPNLPNGTAPFDKTVNNPFNNLKCDNSLFGISTPGTQNCIAAGNSIGTSSTIGVGQLLRPNPLYGTQSATVYDGKNGYDGLQAKIEKRMSHGLLLRNSFTWSKMFEDTSLLGSNGGFWQQVVNMTEHKIAGEDRPFLWTIAGVWELPFGRGKQWGSHVSRMTDMAVGGWKLVGGYQAYSGVPIVFGTDSFWSGNSAALGKNRTHDKWFDTSQFRRLPASNTDIYGVCSKTTPNPYPGWTGVFSMPGSNYHPNPATACNADGSYKTGTMNGVYQDYGTYKRNWPTRWANIRQQGISKADLGVYKSFALPINEATRLELRMDVFNALNHPQFGAPNTDPTNASFGKIGVAQQNYPRQFEFSGKFYF